MRLCSPLREHPPSRHTHRGRNHTVGAGHDHPAPPCRPARHTPPRTHTPKPPTRDMRAPRQAPRQGGQSKANHAHPPERQHQETQTPQANTPNPNHPPSKHAHNKPRCHPHANTKAPTPQRVGAAVRAQGDPWQQGDRPERSADTRRGHADSAHNKARKQRGLRRVRLRPQGEDSAREGRTRLAHACRRGLSVFVGVFAGVCRLFWAGGFWVFGCFFGVFGVFSGFLIFLGCCGCGLFGFVLVRFGWGLLCLVLSVFVVLTRLLIL